MYITREELNKRLTKTELQVIEKKRKVRNDIGSERLDHGDRVLIGSLSAIDKQQNVADFMGVSQTTVSNASRGMIAPASGIDPKLKEEVRDKSKEYNKKIEDQLVTNLAAALGHVANNLESTKAPEASKIAVDMSKILDRVTGRSNEKGNKTAIIINVPAMKEEKSYQTITV